jgi:transitional endoplasmic reticulum ATPase
MTGRVLIIVNCIIVRFVGEAEKELEKVFQFARAHHPCFILCDDIDLLCPQRGDVSGDTSTEAQRRIGSSLLSLIDGVDQTKGIFILGERDL